MSKNNLAYVLMTVLTASIFMARNIYADVAPDPIARTFSYLPIVLVAVVAIVAFILIKKLFAKN